VAWVVVGIIWLWGTMLIAIFYPLLDGGVQQILEVYRGLTSRTTENVVNGKEKVDTENVVNGKEKVDTGTSPSSLSGGSVNDVPHAKEPKSED